MTINYINIGSSANKGDGDTLRTAFRKINENFAFLSTSSGFISTGSSTSLSISPSAPSTATDGTLWFNSTEARTFVRYNGVWVDASPQITPPPTTSTETIITMGSVPPDTGEGTLWFNVNDARTYINYSGAWIDSSPQVTPPSILPADNIGVLANDGNGNLYWTTASITASTGTSVDLTTVTSHILPSADLTYDLGSLSKQWRSLYVGTSTIYIGGVAVSVNTASNTLVVGTSTQAVTVATEDYVATQIAAIPVTENYIGTGNFTVTASDTVNYVVAGTGVSTSTVIFNFRIHGSVGGVAPGVSDPEYVTITTGSQPISAIYLTKYVSADNRAFFAIQEGNQWTIPQNQVTPEMIAYGHFGVNGVQVGQNILSGFGPLEPNTTYTFWIQQIGAAVTEYVFATDRFDTGGISTTFYSQNPLAPTTITPTTSVVGGELDPTLSLIRGYKYTFNVNAPGQPLWIMTTSTYNITNGYSHGVTNNGTSTGIITFTVPGNAPDTLYYISESSSLLMKGVINISGVTSNSSNGNIVQSATAPTGTTSTLWYDTVSGRSYVYYDNSWVDTSPLSTYTFTGTSTLVNGTSTVSLSSTGTLTVPGSIIPSNDLQYNLGSPDKQWHSLYVGTGTVYIGTWTMSSIEDVGISIDRISTVEISAPILSIQRVTSINDFIRITSEGFNSSASIASFVDYGAYQEVKTTSEGVYIGLDSSTGTSKWSFVDGNLTFPNNNVLQKSTSLIECVVNTSTVVYTSTDSIRHTVKLLVQVEGDEHPNTNDKDTQSCEIIAIKNQRNQSVVASVYGVVHTSIAPLATFTAERNTLTNNIEILCMPVSTTSSVFVKTFATEITT